MTIDPPAVAQIIAVGFDRYRQAYRAVTRDAQARFEAADWSGIQTAAAKRIQLYKDFYRDTLAQLEQELSGVEPDAAQWAVIRDSYEMLLPGRPDADLAETGFNTIFRKRARGIPLSDAVAFVSASVRPVTVGRERLTRQYDCHGSLNEMLREVLAAYPFAVDYIDRERDIALMASAMNAAIPLLRHGAAVRLEMIESVFFRNKGAYLIGRMFVDEHLFPIAIPLRHVPEQGLEIETILWNENDLSMIFSFTRAYFMVTCESPAELVDFLQDLLPMKKRWELFTALGFFKHGKTEFYRGFLAHLDASDDEFVIAPGIKGMVMAVFTLPSYQTVFKIIKDRFSPTKKVSREQVMSAYSLVKTHDRVGRMADTQEFSEFTLPRARFSEELLAYLQKVAPSALTIIDETVTISHLYTERQMTPLNLFIDDCSPHQLAAVLEDYGNAIRQLAAANIFPGDMLLKNFGVTRHGRVVFYDYDEICYLTEVNFRDIPLPRYEEERMAAEPWYDIGPNDVFPEEFANFLFSSATYKTLFMKHHAELFTAAFWQGIQDNVAAAQVLDVYPYRIDRQFSAQ